MSSNIPYAFVDANGWYEKGQMGWFGFDNATKDSIDDYTEFAEKYFTNAVIIGHNVAGADLDALVKALKRYNLDIPELYYICTLDLARQYIPSYAVADYSMSTLCEYFGIDIDSEHNAFDDACACADLFKAIIEEYDIDIKDIKIKKYEPCVEKEFSQFVASPVIRKAISEFYGVIRGFSIDNEISTEEVDFIKKKLRDVRIYVIRNQLDD
jgi:DNA polymerase-3 subunit epsilon